MVQSTTSLHPFDTTRFVIGTGSGHNLLVNAATADLFRLLRHEPDAEAARLAFNNRFAAGLSSAAFQELVQSKLGGYDILLDDNLAIKRPAPHEYIKLKTQFISPNGASILSRPFSYLFSPRVFWVVLFTALLIPGLIYHHHFFVQPITQSVFTHKWASAALVYFSILVHEIGHIAACQRFKVQHGGIGFGFYYLFPVFYADISNVWQATRQQRVIANLGGIFAQLILANFLLILFWLDSNTIYFSTSFSITIVALWQLIPFVRRDGYWLLVDITNTPNLMDRANQLLKDAFTKKVSFYDKLRKDTFRNIFSIVYGIINILVTFIFIIYTLFSYNKEVLNFPATLLKLISSVGTTHFWNIFDQINLLTIAFYIIIAKWILEFSFTTAKKLSSIIQTKHTSHIWETKN